MSFIYHSYFNPCPITGNTKSGCRTNQQTGLVHCRCGVDHPDFIHRGEDSIGFPMFARLEDIHRYKDEKYHEWLEEKQRERAIREQQRQKQLERKLSPKQLDREYKQLLAQLSLKESDRFQLKQRGLSDEQIEKAGYVSVKQWQKIDSRGINRRLPGLIGNNGITAKLNVISEGILIPVKDKDGFIVGCQVRLHNPDDGGKYRWLSSPKDNNTPHNKLGEMPLSVFNRGCSETVYVCEGVGFKPLIASIRLNAPVIGASGGNFAGSANTLKQSLEALGAKKIILLPDGGSLFNRHVLGQYKRLFSLLQQWGYEVASAYWGQYEKDHNDIDEITDEVLHSIQYLTVEQFLSLAPNAVTSHEKTYPNHTQENEPDTELYNAYVHWENEQEIILKAQQKQSFFEKQLAKIQKLFSKGKKRVHPPSSKQIEREIKADDDVTDIWLTYLKAGNHIFDNRHCGEGKNHTILNLIKTHLNVLRSVYQHIFLIDSNHRNPSIKELEEYFVDLNPRTSTGYIRDEKGHLIAPPPGTDIAKLDIKPNCPNTEYFNAAYERGYDPNDKIVTVTTKDGKTKNLNPICAKCQFVNQCSYDGNFFKAQRKAALESFLIRCDYRSLPRLFDISDDDDGNKKLDYTKCLFLVDEPSCRLKPSTTIVTDYNKLIRQIDDAASVKEDAIKLADDELKLIDDIRGAIKELTQTKTYHGINGDDVLKSLKAVVQDWSILKSAISKISQHIPDFDSLIPECERYQDIPSEIRKGVGRGAIKAYLEHERNEQASIAKKKINELPPNALIYILKAINGESGIGIRLKYEQITITLDVRKEYADIFNQGQIVFLDATATKERLAYLVPGLNLDNLVVLGKTDKPLLNVTIHAIKTDGFKTNKPSVKALERVKKVIAAIKNKHLDNDIPIITHKKLKEALSAQGHWFYDSRGSNEFMGKPVMIFAGLPNPNLGAIEDEFFAANGNLDGVGEHYHYLIISELIQGVGGRSRSQRYPDKQFHIYLVHGDDELDLGFLLELGASVVYEHAAQYDIEAGTKGQVIKHQIIQAIKMGHRTQQAIALKIGCTQQNISKVLLQAGVTLDWLISKTMETLPSGDTTSSSKDYIRESCETLVEYLTHFQDFFGVDPIASAIDAVEWLLALGAADFWALFEPCPEATKVQLLGFLYSLIDNDESIRRQTG